jgi:2-polyprenyl-3-methyl-5-hydroxy-6-metoxy-1,4-benzoquinol methylase
MHEFKKRLPLESCYYCKCVKFKPLHRDVGDYYYESTNDSWQIYQCVQCSALHLKDPPEEDEIHFAYKTYYTHNTISDSFLGLKSRINQLKISTKNFITEAIIEKSLFGNVAALFYEIPYQLWGIKTREQGRVLDVGCGNAYLLRQYHQHGWDCTGIEIDCAAISNLRNDRFRVIQGSYKKLDDLATLKYHIIICSHVIEHVYDPIDLMNKLLNILTDESVLYLSFPNKNSKYFHAFGRYWRGLEVPRHISIPDQEYLKKRFPDYSFQSNRNSKSTLAESIFYLLKTKKFTSLIGCLLRLIITPVHSFDGNDFTELTVKRRINA